MSRYRPSERCLSVFSALLDDQAEKEMCKDRFNPFGLDLLDLDFFKIKKIYLYMCMRVSV